MRGRSERRRLRRRIQRRRMRRRDQLCEVWWDGWKPKEREQPGRHSKVARKPVYESDPYLPIYERPPPEISDWD